MFASRGKFISFCLPLNSMKIVIVGGFGYKDIGDEAILKTMLLRLRYEIPGVDITVLSINPEDTALQHNVKSLHSYSRCFKGKKGMLRAIKHFLWTFLPRTPTAWLLIEPPLRLTLQEMDSAELVISSGGGFLNEVFRKDLLPRLFEIAMIKRMRKKLMLYGQTIGPFYSRSIKLLVSLILNHVDIISVRDEGSRRILTELGVDKPPIFLTSDEAILLPSADATRVKQILSGEGIALGNNPVIGITARTWFHLHPYQNLEIAKKKFENYKQVIASSADFLVENLDAEILFIPMQTLSKHPYDDDRNIALEIKSKMNRRDKANIIMNQYRPEEIKGIIQNTDLLIGTRFHSLLFAATTGVPIVSISYWFKIDDFMRVMGQEKYNCDINDITVDDLINKCMDAWSKRLQIRKSLLEKSEKLKQKALLNAKLARYLLYAI